MTGGKQTHREVLEIVAKRKKKPVEELLKLPTLPYSIGYLWGWFAEVKTGDSITYTEIKSWSEMTGKNVRVFEVEIIMRLESIYQDHQCQQQQQA